MSAVVSKWTQLRRNAWSYYDAVVYPCNADRFDLWNPRPRNELCEELERISERERKEGGRTW